MIVITGATGRLGRLVIQALLRFTLANQIVAAVRNSEKAADLAALGVQVREADYSKPETLATALVGAKKLLLVSSHAGGACVAHHRAVIEAAQKAQVELIVYTSVLNAMTSPLGLAGDHRQTEALLHASGLPTAILRNGWYFENYTVAAPGAVLKGRCSDAPAAVESPVRRVFDYAEAAAVVLTRGGQQGMVYELAGDEAFTLTELAAEISRQSGKPVAYKDLAEGQYEEMLVKLGVPDHFAALLADSDRGASKGALFHAGHQLSQLIGRPTTSLSLSVATALAT